MYCGNLKGTRQCVRKEDVEGIEEEEEKKGRNMRGRISTDALLRWHCSIQENPRSNLQFFW